MSLFDLAGRTAPVTGSCRGLGRAMAEGLAAAGGQAHRARGGPRVRVGKETAPAP